MLRPQIGPRASSSLAPVNRIKGPDEGGLASLGSLLSLPRGNERAGFFKFIFSLRSFCVNFLQKLKPKVTPFRLKLIIPNENPFPCIVILVAFFPKCFFRLGN